MNFPGEQFLHKKDSKLHIARPVELEMERKKIRGEEIFHKPAEKISGWLKVIEKTHLGHREEPEVLERIKDHYYKENVIKSEDIPESYFENQKRLAREQGHGDIEISEELRKQSTEVIIADQKSTLDSWVDYFMSPDSDSYPMWAKYWVFTNMLKLSTFDKEKHAFAKRDKGTVAPFPDLNREALAYVVDAIVKTAEQEKVVVTENNPELQQLLNNASFGKLYAYAIEKVTPTEKNELETTEGKWVKYKKNSDHMPLVSSLQGYGTGWCTAGESTAKTQLQGGDFYVYYSYDKNGKPIIPRAAIRMQGSEIGEVRGIAKEQNLDPYIGDVVKAKMKEFPDGEKYEKRSSDMKRLTEIEAKTQKGEQLKKDELVFLYEINSKIEGFGYQRDPRIKEVLYQRNLEQDLLIVFECTQDQIAHNSKEINENTKVYIGRLEPGIFNKTQEYNIEHICNSFLKGIIRKMEVEIGGKNKERLLKEMKEKKINISDHAKQMLGNLDFITSEKSENIDLIRLSVKDLGFFENAGINQIYKKAQELGLELCPAETGPNLRLQNSTSDRFFIGMKQIAGHDGRPNVFKLAGHEDGLWLSDSWLRPRNDWDPDNEFVFRLRELES